MRSGVGVPYLHQSLHLGSVRIRVISQAVSLRAELSQLGPQRGHRLVETHLKSGRDSVSFTARSKSTRPVR